MTLPVIHPDTPLHMCAPFGLEIAECTVAPVAMEDSDHEVHSSSDEQDSCPASPNHNRDHDVEQVPVTPPKNSLFNSPSSGSQLLSLNKKKYTVYVFYRFLQTKGYSILLPLS